MNFIARLRLPCFFAIFALSFSRISLAQTPADTFTLTACNYFWKTGEPVPSLLVGADNTDPSGVCGTFKFSPPNLVDGFCPFGLDTLSDPVNGITVADIIVMAKHILGIEPLAAPYGRLAADVSGNHAITTFDIVRMKNLILGIQDPFPGDFYWRSASEYFDFSNIATPCAFEYNPALSSQTINMIAWKNGDADGDADPDGAYEVPQTLSEGYLDVPDILIAAGTTVDVPVYFSPGGIVTGMQFALKLDTLVGKIDSVKSGAFELEDSSNYFLSSADLFRLAWFDGASLSGTFLASDEPLFTLKISATETFYLKEALRLDSLTMPALWVDENVEVHPFAASLTSAISQPNFASHIRVSPPSPNPFSQRTFLKIELDSPEKIYLEVTDAMGRQLWRQEQWLGAGSHTLEIPSDAVRECNMAFYRIFYDEGHVSGKLLRQ